MIMCFDIFPNPQHGIVRGSFVLAGLLGAPPVDGHPFLGGVIWAILLVQDVPTDHHLNLVTLGKLKLDVNRRVGENNPRLHFLGESQLQRSGAHCTPLL